MEKVNVGIIGTGNIGMDLLMKIQRSPFLTCSVFAGHNIASEGIKRAKEMGVLTTYDSVHYFEENPDCCSIVFDATSANVHAYNAPILKQLNKFVIDLTPAHVGPFCIPALNIEEVMNTNNVNLITCGGQASVPIAYAITQAQPDVQYIEIVATIASKSAGPGTRANIDEFTQTTSDALAQFTGISRTKAIIILNPSEPPITMRNTIYALINDPNMKLIQEKVDAMVRRIRDYVPGYQLIVPPVYQNGRLTITVEVLGKGDYLPKYAGNLDIITCAAQKAAEEYAKRMLGQEVVI